MIKLLIIISLIVLYNLFFIKHELFENLQKTPVDSKCFYRQNTEPILDYNNYISPDYNKFHLLGSKKAYIVPSNTFTKKDILKVIHSIKLSKTNTKYQEIRFPKYSVWKTYKPFILNKNKLLTIFMYIENKIITLLKKIQKEDHYKHMFCINYNDCIPYIINRSIIKIEQHNSNYKYYISFEIYVKKKIHSHIFYAEIELNNKQYYINALKLIGYQFEDTLKLNKGYEKNNHHINIYTDPRQFKYNANNDYLRQSDEKKLIFPNNITNQLIKKHSKNNIFNDYRCYGKQAYNKRACEMGINELGNKTVKGVWDKPCIYDSECPFYQKNKNYPNRRGGCINSKCELPIGLTQLGIRYYDKNTAPLCYNCKNSTLNCCKDQENKNIYDNLQTPDYVFKHDFIPRYNYKHLFYKKHLQP